MRELLSKEEKNGRKEDLTDKETNLTDIFEALKSDMEIYSHLIVEKEKSIAVKTNNTQSFYIFDASQEIWLEEPDMKNFQEDNYLVFSFSENQQTTTFPENIKKDQLIQKSQKETVNELTTTEIKMKNNEKSGKL